MKIVWVSLLAFAAAFTASADLTSSAGNVIVLASPPASVVVNDNVIQSNSDAHFFTEQTGVTLPSDVSVDIDAPGTYQSNASLTGGTISAGTVVNSYYLDADPVDNSNDYVFSGTLTFSAQILGIMVLDAELGGSNGVLGAPGTLYSSTGQGLELGNPADGDDSLTWSGNTVSFDFVTSDAADDIRIVTAASVPESSAWLLYLTCVGLCFAVKLRMRVSSL